MSNESLNAYCYVAEGKLYLKRPGDAVATLVDSSFVQEILDRAERNRERNDWRQEGIAWNFGRSMPMRGSGDGPQAPPAESRRIRFTGIADSNGGDNLYYALDTDYVGGLFEYDTRLGYERRLYHAQQFRATDLSRHHATGQLAMSLREKDGTCHIAIADANGRKLRKVTEGDVVDECPAWVDGSVEQIVYQTAGVGRNEAGIRAGLSSYAVQMLDLKSGTITTTLESDSHDFLLPHVDARDGSLLFIRRPYLPTGQPVSAIAVAKDVLFFPFRFARAVVHFLDFFSRVFSKEPLMTAGGPKQQGPGQGVMMLWGKLIDAEKEMGKSRNGQAALVPGNWELVRRSKSGSETVLASSVLAFDQAADGTILHTNGSRLFAIDAKGVSQEIARGKFIERVKTISLPNA